MMRIREILRLKHEVGLPLRSIARAVHASIGTMSEYLSKVKEVAVLARKVREALGDAKPSDVNPG